MSFFVNDFFRMTEKKGDGDHVLAYCLIMILHICM